jgi:hypothetical protein
VPDGPVIALAKLRLEKSKLKMPCETRAQALNILRSIQPAPAKNAPLNIKSASVVHDACRNCGKPIPFGTPCKVCFNGELPEHISCKKVSKTKRQEEAALRKLYLEAIKQVSW